MLSTVGNVGCSLGIMGNVVKNCVISYSDRLYEIIQSRGGCTVQSLSPLTQQHLYSSQVRVRVLCFVSPTQLLPISQPASLSELQRACRAYVTPFSRWRGGGGRGGGRVRRREKGRRRRREGVCLSCISDNITATPASVTGKQGRRREIVAQQRFEIEIKTPAAALPPPTRRSSTD